MNDNGLRSSIRINAAGLSDVGRMRSENQDAFAIDADIGLFLVADGMGGHKGGAEASATAVRLIHEGLRQQFADAAGSAGTAHEHDDDDDDLYHLGERIVPVLVQTNQALYGINQARGNGSRGGMGTTVVGLWCRPGSDSGYVFHVGDSRLYRLRDGRLRRMTRDHTFYQFWLDSGRVGDAPPRNQLMRSMGPMASVEPELQSISVEFGDRFLLCSDGLTNKVDDEELQDLLAGARGNYPALCQQLVDLANDRGGEDNITVLLAWYG